MTAPDESRPVGRAAFLGGLLACLALVELSIIGIGHSRSLKGAANAQYWIVAAIVAAGTAAVTVALARATVTTRFGAIVRAVVVAASAIGVALFVWETVALGTGAMTGPMELLFRR